MFMYIIKCFCRNLVILGLSDEICVLDTNQLIRAELDVSRNMSLTLMNSFESTLASTVRGELTRLFTSSIFNTREE